jgi:stage II sporulation SpoAA-like protein
MGLLATGLQQRPASVAITYTISPEQRLIRAYASGIVRADDLHSFLDKLLEDPRVAQGLRALYDARFAEPDITILQLAEVAGKAARVVARGVERVAIVAQSANTIRVAKTFAVLAAALGIDVDVFNDLSDAEAWLDEPRAGDPSAGDRLDPRA